MIRVNMSLGNEVAKMLNIIIKLRLVQSTSVFHNYYGSWSSFSIAMREFDYKYEYNKNEHPERELSHKNNKELS